MSTLDTVDQMLVSQKKTHKVVLVLLCFLIIILVVIFANKILQDKNISDRLELYLNEAAQSNMQDASISNISFKHGDNDWEIQVFFDIDYTLREGEESSETSYRGCDGMVYETFKDCDTPTINEKKYFIELYQINVRERQGEQTNTYTYKRGLQEFFQTTARTNYNEADAVTYAQMFVKDKLVSPSTAVFPADFSNYQFSFDDENWTVKGYVDAQNSFGAMIRSNYTVVFIVSGVDNGKANLVSINIE